MNVDTKPTVVIQITQKELSVAEYCGLLVEHPLEERLIALGGNSVHENTPPCEHIDVCIVTKNTREYLEDTPGYALYIKPDYDYRFELEADQ